MKNALDMSQRLLDWIETLGNEQLEAIHVFSMVTNEKGNVLLIIGEEHVGSRASWKVQNMLNNYVHQNTCVLLERPQFTKEQRIVMGGPPKVSSDDISPTAFVGIEAPSTKTCVAVDHCAQIANRKYAFVDPRNHFVQASHDIFREFSNIPRSIKDLVMNGVHDAMWELIHTIRQQMRDSKTLNPRCFESGWGQLALIHEDAIIENVKEHMHCAQRLQQGGTYTPRELDALPDLRGALDVVMLSYLASLEPKRAVYMCGYRHADDVLTSIVEHPQTGLLVVWSLKSDERNSLTPQQMRNKLLQFMRHQKQDANCRIVTKRRNHRVLLC